MAQAQQEEKKVFEFDADGKLVVVEPTLKSDVTALVEVDREAMLAEYAPNVQELIELSELAKGISVTDETQTEAMEEAKKLRLKIVKVRTGADKKRETMKASSLRKWQAIDGIFRVLKAECQKLEETLEAAENFAKIKEQERKDYLKAERRAMIESYVLNPTLFNFDALGEISEDSFFELLEKTKSEHDQSVAKARAEEEAKAKEEEERRKETERLKAENEKLRAEEAKRKEEESKRLLEEKNKREAEESEARKKREDAEAEAKRLKAESFGAFLKAHGVTKEGLENGEFYYRTEVGAISLYKRLDVYTG